MNYLVVAESCFLDRPGGAHRVAWDVAKVMRDRGHAVTLLCYRSGPAAAGPETLEGIEVVRFAKTELPAWHPRRLSAIIDAAGAACREWLGGRRFDVVHVHTPLVGLGVAGALGDGPRYVYTVHSPVVLEQEIVWKAQGWPGRLKLLLGRGLLASVERRMLARADRIQTLSEFTRRQLDHSYGVGNRVTVVPHWYARINSGVSKADARRELGWPADAQIFFTVRAMGPRYGLDVALKALAPLLKEHDAYFFLGGDGPWRGRLEALGKSLDPGGPAGPRIRFMGRISDRELELAYAAADLFILPTLALECFGLITLEAFAFGCPVLSTDAGAIPETMQPILPELIVPAGDELALRAAARKFLQGGFRLPEGRALIDYAAGRYGAAAVIPQICALLEAPDSARR